MLRLAALYGALPGLAIILTTIITIELSPPGAATGGVLLGYLVMLLALTAIFFGVKRYRDGQNGGVITFGAAFAVGLVITLAASAVYTVIWEIYGAVTDHAFMDAYAAAQIERATEAGASAEKLAALEKKIENALALQSNLFARLLITLTEIAPVGLLVSLISAAVLRNPKVLPRRA